ncbi:hypothetical protein AB0L65_45385 [Nonomuraea sp. NPDC052116]|uniref:hypothetical protein n=1 Tax=Nonomuraea sp. NPDC052116 TaxID=3155665 RepID=UPI00343A222B
MIVDLERPRAKDIVKEYLKHEAGFGERAAWLDDPESVFYNLLPKDSAPSEAIRLATLMMKAENADDKEILDEYHGWKSHLDDWFAKGGDQKVEERAIRIAAAFLDKTPASVVLDSADRLLAYDAINWPVPQGGPLALPDAEERLQSVGMSFDEPTGIATFVHESQGPAILRRIWTRHVQLSNVLTVWLQDISQGPANEHLDILAISLAKLAETVGIGPIFTLAESWLQGEGKQNSKLVADLISDLAVHPTLGSKSRSELSKWAKVGKYPARQRAVAIACAGLFGRTYTSMALTRIRYILESPGDTGDTGAGREAINALRSLAAEEALTPAVVDAVVKWASHSDDMINVYFDVFGSPSLQPMKSPLEVAFSLAGDSGRAVRNRLLDAWKHIIEQGKHTSRAEEILLNWRQGAEKNHLPMEPVVNIFLKLRRVMEPPLKAAITPDGPFKDALLSAFANEYKGSTDSAPNVQANTAGSMTAVSESRDQIEVNPEMQ